MAPSDPTQTEGSCCHRSIIQFGEIKSELKNIRRTVDVAVQLLSKLVGLTPNDIQALACSSEVNTCTSASVMDGLSVSSASDSILRRDTARESMYVSLNQTAVMNGVSAKVKAVAKAENGKTTSETEVRKIYVEANEETGIEAGSFKSAVETRNNKDSSKVKYDKFPRVNISTISLSSLSEQLTTFLKTNPPTAPLSENATVNTAKDCATVLGHSVTSEYQAVVADSDISVSAVQADPRHKKTDSIIQADTIQDPSLCDVTSSNMLPAVCDLGVSAAKGVCTNLVVAKAVMTDLEMGPSNVEVKQEKQSVYGDTDLSVFAGSVEDRLQEPEEVKMEPEGVFISDSMLPVCVLMKKEDGFCTANTQENSTVSHAGSNSTEQFSGENSVVNTGSKLITCNKDEENGHMVQDSQYQETSSLHSLLGSALVSKLKQKIQEKIQATVYAVNEEKKVNEDESGSVTNTNKCIEKSHPFRKDCKTSKKLMVSQSKLRQKFYQCKLCAKIFFCNMALHVHKNHCRGLQKQYHCSSCPLMFKSRTVLFNHRQLHSAKKLKHRHKCEVCGREFILKSTLKKHRQSQVCKGTRMKYYRKLPQYFCGECGEGFLNSSNLELHQKLHKVGKTHSSSSATGNTGISNRSGSVVVSRTVRRYPCSYCDEAFIDRRSVTLHEKLHTDKEFAAFDQERKMIQRRHQLTMMLQKQQQSSKKKFGCDVCGRCYSIELLLHMHTRLHHAIS